MRHYKVRVQPKHMGLDDCVAEFDIDAPNKKEAVKEARRRVQIEMLWDRHDGPLEYTAELQ